MNDSSEKNKKELSTQEMEPVSGGTEQVSGGWAGSETAVVISYPLCYDGVGNASPILREKNAL